MQLTNEWIEKGKIEGRVEGRAEGRYEGRREGVLRMLRHRGIVSADLEAQIEGLANVHLDDLFDAALDFKDAAQARQWLADRLHVP